MMNFIVMYWVEGVLTLISTILVFMFKLIHGWIQEQKVLKLGMQALLRDRIIQAYNHYMDKQLYPIYARENVNALFTQYTNLKGNGTIKKLVEQLDLLPTDPKGDDI